MFLFVFIWFVVGIALQDSMEKTYSVLSLLYHHTIKVTHDTGKTNSQNM